MAATNDWLANFTTTTSGSWYLNTDDDDGNQSILAATIATVAAPDKAFGDLLEDSRFWIQRVLLPIIATIGLFGNGATILVLTRRGMRSSTNAYLTALAIADLAYLLCIFWLSLTHYPQVKKNLTLANFYAYTWPYGVWLTDATTSTSVWLTVTFTVERYIAVCHPIRGRMLCTESRAKRVIVAVYLICFSATLPTPFEWEVKLTTDPLTNETKAYMGSSELGKNQYYQTFYYWFTSITFVLLPLTLLIIFNSFLIQSVRESQKLRQIMTQRQTISGTSDREERAASNEIRITVTLIAVVIMFLVCQLPTAATLIYKIFHEPESGSNDEAILRTLGNIFNSLVSLNAACNFLLYCALSDKYRRTFMATFCPCLYRPASPVHSMAFFTQVDDCPANHQQQHHIMAAAGNHTRQSSVRIDRYSTTGRQSNRPAGPYLAIPDANGTTPRLLGKTQHRPSLQSTPLRSKWWPWQSKSSQRNNGSTTTKASNILIQISDVEEINHVPLQQPREHSTAEQVDDEEQVAFV